MAELVENDKDKFPNSRVGKSNFLSSIRDFKPEGVRVGVERVSKIFPIFAIDITTKSFAYDIVTKEHSQKENRSVRLNLVT